MTPREEREWVELQGRSPDRQVRAIRNLIAHAREDRMSADDLEVCRRQLLRLKVQRCR